MLVQECPRCWKPLVFKGTVWKGSKTYGSYVCPECFTWIEFEVNSSCVFDKDESLAKSS